MVYQVSEVVYIHVFRMGSSSLTLDRYVERLVKKILCTPFGIVRIIFFSLRIYILIT